MKPLFLLIAICILFSCSDNNNDEIDEDRLITNFKALYESTIHFVELNKMVEGDSIFKIGGVTKSGTLSYSIVSQTPKNAFKIDADTGIIRVNDESLIHTVPLNNIFIINVEIRNEDVIATCRLNLYVNTWITTECELAMNRFYESFSEVISYDVYTTLEIEGDEFQISFSVKSEKNLCSIGNWFSSNNTEPILVELTDAEGEELLKVTLQAQDADGWAGDYTYLYDILYYLDIPLKSDEVYTLKATGNHFVSYVHKKKNDEAIVFPIDLDVFTIVGTQYTDKDGNIYTDNTICIEQIYIID
ncbi:cadherin repeat domain-containing protein [Formosa sp. S-31]|uniref:cadherin repeat domain-containing protein n=1 Tax=Formosa sp. S-31 TaxID=2790949 RepID=UPI003EBCC89F